jgi:hypothetical protein
MVSSAKGHAGIKGNNQLVRLPFVLNPGWAYHKALTDPEQAKMLFPSCFPVLLDQLTSGQFGLRNECSHKPNAYIDLSQLAMRSGRNVGTKYGVIGLRLFDRKAPAMPIEQVGNGFDEFARDPDAEFQPLQALCLEAAEPCGVYGVGG